MIIKICKNCGKEFIQKYKHKRYFCSKKCREGYWFRNNSNKSKEYMKKYYLTNKDKLDQVNKKWQIEHPIKMKRYRLKHYLNNKEEYNKKNKKWAKRNPLIRKAQTKAGSNIKLKSSCEICNSKGRLQRHHWNYNKPLMVNTLCKTCHSIQHIKNFNKSIYGGLCK